MNENDKFALFNKHTLIFIKKTYKSDRLLSTCSTVIYFKYLKKSRNPPLIHSNQNNEMRDFTLLKFIWGKNSN